MPYAEIKIFGSQARGDARQFSDFDILIHNEKPLTFLEIADLQDAFLTQICRLGLI